MRVTSRRNETRTKNTHTQLNPKPQRKGHNKQLCVPEAAKQIKLASWPKELPSKQ